MLAFSYKARPPIKYERLVIEIIAEFEKLEAFEGLSPTGCSFLRTILNRKNSEFVPIHMHISASVNSAFRSTARVYRLLEKNLTLSLELSTYETDQTISCASIPDLSCLWESFC
jgi:hypothetical protein